MRIASVVFVDVLPGCQQALPGETARKRAVLNPSSGSMILLPGPGGTGDGNGEGVGGVVCELTMNLTFMFFLFGQLLEPFK